MMNEEIKNNIDKNFFNLIGYISCKLKEELIDKLKDVLNQYKEKHNEVYIQLVDYYKKYNFWGIIDEENNNYENLINRVNVLKDHLEDFIWLYNKLKDYQSKYTLYCILLNWLALNIIEIDKIKPIFKQYFDLDIISTTLEEVFVDCGAYTGDTLLDYDKVFGQMFKSYYMYEMNEDCIIPIMQNIIKYNLDKNRIFIKKCGVGNVDTTLYKEENKSASKITNEGTQEVKLFL